MASNFSILLFPLFTKAILSSYFEFIASNICSSSWYNKEIKYLEDKILTSDREAIIKRNEQKTRVVCRLIGAAKVGAFDYSIYYFSRNLEHVFHDISDDLTDDEKVEYADEVAEKYGTSPEDFLDFIRADDIAVFGSYKETWDYIMQNTNSLKRNSNFHIIFEEEKK